MKSRLPHRTVSIDVVRALLAHAERRGVAAAGALSACGFERPMAAVDREARVAADSVAKLWDVVSAIAKDESLGLRFADGCEEGAFDVLDHAVCASASPLDALRRVERFHRLVSDELAIEIVETAETTRVTRLVGGTHPQEQDAFFAVLIDRLRRVDRALSPRTVRLEAAPHAEQALSAYFAAPIHFGSARAELVFATADLRRPSPRANPYLAAVLDRHANDLLARLPATSSYADHVRRVIARVIERGSPSLEAVAHELHASPRTVQRRLAELGTSHKALVEEVRRSLAEQHLESERSLTAVAFSLGYRAESSFRRAYRKWTGRRARARRA